MEINQTHPGDNITQEVKEPSFPTSKLDLSHRRSLSHIFGQIEPHFVLDSVPDDSPITLHTATDLNTLSLQSPQKSSISMNKDYYSVPLEAIYPNSFEKFYVNPTIGEDVPDDVCGSVMDYTSKIAKVTYALSNDVVNSFDSFQMNWSEDDKYTSMENAASFLRAFFRYMAHLRLVYSLSSLQSQLKFKMYSFFEPNFELKTKYSIDFADDLIDKSITDLVNLVNVATETASEPIPYFIVYFRDLEGNTIETSHVCFQPYRFDYNHPNEYFDLNLIGIREFLMKCCEMPIFDISFSEAFFDNFRLVNDQSDFSSLISGISTCTYGSNDRSIPVDISRLWAYQLICAHFYSNDAVDYIYSATLFRELVASKIVSNNGNYDNYSLNGITIPYDYLSAHYFNKMLDIQSTTTLDKCLDYLSTLLCHQRSLRFVDYFTGAKTRPLAVGDLSIDVENNAVDVVDVTRNIQMQRFLNAVNRSGRKFGDYVKGVFGISTGYDYHNPAYLAHTHDTIYGQDVQNTGDAQQTDANSVTSTMHNINSDRFEFQFYCDRPSILMGVIYFDVPRAYAFSNDRQIFARDRFDMFNPYFQYVGDQKIYRAELDARYSSSTDGELDAMGYTLRNMEYKLIPDDVCGAYVKNLRTWVFIADLVDQNSGELKISPSYIRSRITELDPFYLALSGYSPASHFHFHVVHSHFITAKRPMAYQPQILK